MYPARHAVGLTSAHTDNPPCVLLMFEIVVRRSRSLVRLFRSAALTPCDASGSHMPPFSFSVCALLANLTFTYFRVAGTKER